MVSRFPVDVEINSKIYLWRGNPWNLEVDAVVNSTNEEVVMPTGLAYVVKILLQNMDKAHCSPGLHDAAVPGLAEECATMIKHNEIMKTGSRIYLYPLTPVILSAYYIRFFDFLTSDPVLLVLNKPPKVPVKGNLPVHNSMDGLAAAALCYDYDEGPKPAIFL
ncbi:putative Macro domain-containing protein [Helianthus anomalus]